MTDLNEHTSYDRLLNELELLSASLAKPWEGRLYRCVALEWARPADLISGKGSRLHGCRWMRPGVERVVHAATTEAVALKEGRGRLTYYRVEHPLAGPRIIVELAVRLAKVVFLADAIDAIPWLELDDLLVEDWRKVNRSGYESLSQAFGRALASLKCEGLMAPSALDRRGRTLFWLPEQLSPGCRVEISGQKDLERWLAK